MTRQEGVLQPSSSDSLEDFSQEGLHDCALDLMERHSGIVWARGGSRDCSE